MPSFSLVEFTGFVGFVTLSPEILTHFISDSTLFIRMFDSLLAAAVLRISFVERLSKLITRVVPPVDGRAS